jgi:hypothetical protein
MGKNFALKVEDKSSGEMTGYWLESIVFPIGPVVRPVPWVPLLGLVH